MATVKRCALRAVLVGVLLSTSVSAQDKLTLTAAQAKEHFGQNATVCGKVVSTSYADSSKGRPTFLNLDKQYPHQIFTVVIWGENRTKFAKPEEDYKGKRICVSGKITAHAGKPEIVVSDPKQIKVE